MTKKIIATSVAMGAMLTLIGCGGGSSSTATSSVATGTAYYIDSAVEGVDYTCGARSGVTGADGSFTFEAGGSCTFYLGDIELRGVDAGLLVDGESVYETDVNIARILQSLDSDGNPNNGITIEAATVQALADEGITSLPTSEAEMDEMLAVIAVNGGTEVSEDDAVEHMLTTLLAGEIFYVVDEAQDGSQQVTELTFNEGLTSIKAISPEMTENWGITIEGSRLTFNEDTDGSYTIISVDPTNDYIMFSDYYSDGSLDGMGHRLYRDKADAEAYFDSLKNSDLTTLLAGKVLYTAIDGQDGTLSSWTFSSDMKTFTWTQIVGGTDTGTEILNVDGMNLYVNVAGETESATIAVLEVTPDYILTSLDGYPAEKVFFDESEARDYYKVTN